MCTTEKYHNYWRSTELISCPACLSSASLLLTPGAFLHRIWPPSSYIAIFVLPSISSAFLCFNYLFHFSRIFPSYLFFSSFPCFLPPIYVYVYTLSFFFRAEHYTRDKKIFRWTAHGHDANLKFNEILLGRQHGKLCSPFLSLSLDSHMDIRDEKLIGS